MLAVMVNLAVGKHKMFGKAGLIFSACIFLVFGIVCMSEVAFGTENSKNIEVSAKSEPKPIEITASRRHFFQIMNGDDVVLSVDIVSS
jgi:hypothetical protein